MSSTKKKGNVRNKTSTSKSKNSPNSVMTKISDLTISSNATAKIYPGQNHHETIHDKKKNGENAKNQNKTEIIFPFDKLQIFDIDVGTNIDADSETVTTNATNITTSTDITILNSNLRPLLPSRKESKPQRSPRVPPTSLSRSFISYSTGNFSTRNLNVNEYDRTHCKTCMMGNCAVYLSLGSSHFNNKTSEQVQCAFERAYSLAKSSTCMGLFDDTKGYEQCNNSKDDIEGEVENEFRNNLSMKENIDISSFSLSPKFDVKTNSAKVEKLEKQSQSYLRRGNEHYKNKEFDEALKSFEIFLSTYRVSNVPITDESAGSIMHKIGLIFLEHKMEYKKAVTFFKDAVNARTICLGDGHIDVMRSMYKLGIAQYALEQYNEAKISFEYALNGYSILFGSNHYIIAEILNNLACVLFCVDDMERSSDMFQKSFSIQTDLLRHDLYGDYEEYSKEKNTRLLNIATTGANMGFINLILGETGEAIPLLESALLNKTLILDNKDMLVMSTMENLGEANKSNPMKSLKMYTRLLRIVTEVFGANHILSAIMWNTIGHLFFQAKNHQRALECTKHVLTCYKKNRDSDLSNISQFKQLLKENAIWSKKINANNTGSKGKALRMASF